MDISPSLFYFLLVLNHPLHGYQIMQEVEKASGGTLKMGAGTCYGLIARCLEDKWIKLEAETDRKKIYRLTEKGKEVLTDETDRLRRQLSMAETYMGDKHD